MDLTVVVPAFNEERVIGEHLTKICRYLDSKRLEAEVLAVDDGSQDGTAREITALAKKEPRIRLVSLEKNSGKGAAVRTGLLAGRGKIRGFTDADASTPISELDRILRALEQGGDVAIGSRAKRSNETSVEAY